MAESSNEWHLSVLAAYSAKWSRRLIQQFQEGVVSVLASVEQHLQVEDLSIELKPVFRSGWYQNVNHGESVDSCIYAVLDVTDFDEDLAHLLGITQGAGIPYVALCQQQSLNNLNRYGLSASSLVKYDEITDLFQSDSPLSTWISENVSRSTILESLVYELWFPRDTPTIWVVCPQCHDAGEFAQPASPDYTYLDNLGDTDALLEIMVFLSRYYPKASIQKFSSEDLPKGLTKDNIVVVGGPGSHEDISNAVCLEMMSSMNSRVSYSSDCERMVIKTEAAEPVELRAELRSEAPDDCNPDRFSVRRDYGYFARFPNPLNEQAAVILVNGIHTTGVLGAAKVFGDGRNALRNYYSIFHAQVNPASFECYFEVAVLNGNIRTPNVDSTNVYPLGGASNAISTAFASTLAKPSVDERATTVLFIVGERGGNQNNQLQTTRERDEIIGAIQASSHRNSFTHAQPIIGVTAQKLTLAYNERPSILHFAGHGDDRSLSFILDHGVIASNTRMVDERLSAIIKQFPNRVRLCVLNTCESAAVADYLVKNDAVDMAIGWSGKVPDSVAIAFSKTFYRCLGDGLDLNRAVQLGAQSYMSSEQPILYTKDTIDPGTVTFIGITNGNSS